MRNLLAGLTLALILPGNAAAVERVLLVGDSWAWFQWVDESHDVVFGANGYANVDVIGFETTENGSTARDWATAEYLQRITDAIADNPEVDTVQLTIGGNDFLGRWRADLTMMEVDDLINTVTADLQTVVDHILSLDPDIHIILSFYDYPNFVDTLTGLSGLICEPEWQDMAMPTAFEINSTGTQFEQSYLQATSHPRVEHVSHFGLMQNAYGFPDMGIAPGDIALPGDLNLPSPLESMREILGIRDCFHLEPEGYDLLVQNLFDHYYQYRFDTFFNGHFE